MSNKIEDILAKDLISKEDIVRLLGAGEEESRVIFENAKKVKEEQVGNKVYFRGLIEYSNYCSKNCLYCGIRAGNSRYIRYQMTDEEVLEAAKYAFDNQFASIVIKSGERNDRNFIDSIERLLKEIHNLSDGKLHVTLSLGEQTEETYRRWFEAGAHRYLLRIEVSNPELYKRLHPADKHHDYNERLEALRRLRKTGFQVGIAEYLELRLPFRRRTKNDPDHPSR